MTDTDAQTQKVPLDQFIDDMPRDCVFVVDGTGRDNDDHVHFAQTIRAEGRRVVLIDPVRASASDLTIVRDFEELELNWQRIGAPEARFIGLRGHTQNECEELCGVSQLNYVVTHKRSAHWVRHTLQNLRHLESPSLLKLAGRYLNVPAFIVGAGPSLDRSIPLLAEASRKGIVIAANAAGKLLPTPPHVTISIESEDTRPLIGDTRGSIRAFGVCCYPDVLTHGSGPLSPIYTTNPSGVCEHLTGIPRLDCCISVSTCAIDLARRLGCNPIVLVGQDMAHTGQAIYAQGAGGGSVTEDGGIEWGQAQRDLTRTQTSLPDFYDPLRVPAWGGQGEVQTHRDFALILKWLGDVARVYPLARQHEMPSAYLIDCTEGGARKPGWHEQPLAEVLGRLPDTYVTPSKLIADMRAAGPLATPDSVDRFRRAHRVLVEAAANRGRLLRQLGEQLLREPAGVLPGKVDDLIGWSTNTSELARAYAANRVYDALEGFRRSRVVKDEAAERRETVEALVMAATAVERECGELVGRLGGSEGRDAVA